RVEVSKPRGEQAERERRAGTGRPAERSPLALELAHSASYLRRVLGVRRDLEVLQELLDRHRPLTDTHECDTMVIDGWSPTRREGLGLGEVGGGLLEVASGDRARSALKGADRFLGHALRQLVNQRVAALARVVPRASTG